MKACARIICFFALWELTWGVTPPQAPGPPAWAQTDARRASPEGRIQLSPEELTIYQNAPSVIDWTPRQVHDCPYLHKLRPAVNQDQLPTILDHTGQTVALMFHNFRNVTCDETIDSKVADYRENRRFHYIVMRRDKGELPAFAEYRTDLNGKTVDLASGDASGPPLFMLTWDFTSTFLFFSPADRHADRYRYLGNEMIRDHECYVVGFAQDPGNVCRPDHFYLNDTDHVVLLQGLAWIDTQTYQILRVTTLLVGSRKDIGLDGQTTSVDFFPVRPLGTDDALWLPRDVRVETEYHRIKIRNLHQYSNFKLFRVESTIKAGP